MLKEKEYHNLNIKGFIQSTEFSPQNPGVLEVQFGICQVDIFLFQLSTVLGKGLGDISTGPIIF